MSLTLQIFHAHQWHDTGLLDIPEPSAGHNGLALLSYHPQQYAIDYLGRDDECAFSLNLPVDLMQTYRSQPWFAFLDDIMPSCASRRYWVKHLGISHLPTAEQDYELLTRGTIAPVGNLRIKEALPTPIEGSQLQSQRFPSSNVTASKDLATIGLTP